MVCGARLNINLWQAVRRRAEGEWNERGNSLLPVVRLSREEKCTGRLCFVPLKCDMRSLTYKLNVTTGGQFYFNRGDHRQATIHFPPFFLSTAVPSLLLCSGFFFFSPFPPLSPLIPRPDSLRFSFDRRLTTKSTDRSSITHSFPHSFPSICLWVFARDSRFTESACHKFAMRGKRETRIPSCSVVHKGWLKKNEHEGRYYYYYY